MTAAHPVKYHGGKFYLAKRINELMPPHTHYAEPYCGGCSVLLEHDPENHSEVINDLDSDLVNFWRIVQDTWRFSSLVGAVERLPFSQQVFDEAFERLSNKPYANELSIERAADFFVVARMSRAGQGRCFATLSRNRTRRGMNEQASSWLTAIECLPEVHARLQRVVITCMDAIKFIKQQDGPKTLFYCDPPYLHATRTARQVYNHEMSEAQHTELLDTLANIQGKYMLSGYRSDLYDAWSSRVGNGRYDFDLPNNAASGNTKRRMTECIWANF
jgi:DNA adenine methylase